MTGEDHECVKDESFRAMTGEFKELSKKVGGLSTDIALVKRDVGDLKSVTMSMSKCIEALTASSIKAGENNITRDQFYGKIDEIVKARQAMFTEAQKNFKLYADAMDARVDKIEKDIIKVQEVCDDYKDMKKWIYGIAASLVLFMLYEGYRLLIHA